jgi:predicted AAA+ superfamily ATPase
MSENYWTTKWSKEQIKALLIEQFQTFWQRDTGILRTQLAEVERLAHVPHAVIISGLRRVGKSTLLAQLAHRLGEGEFYYVNFEDDRFLDFKTDDANDLFQNLVELFGDRKVFLIDEVQNVAGWERFVRRFMDMGFKFYLTGSNASLLSRELGSMLTGRYILVELFPFSFDEFLRFHKFAIPDMKRLTTVNYARLGRMLSDYLKFGGIPEPLKYPELPLLRTLYEDVLYRDIAARYRIDEIRALKELAFFLMSNVASPISFNRLKEQLRLGSVNTVKNYVEYMENSWLLFTLNVYDYSVKRQQIAAKKVYSIDTGLASTVGFAFSPNTGKLLENLVFLALRRKTKEIYYFTTQGGYEVDFYLPEMHQMIQVVQNMNQPATQAREKRAMLEALRQNKGTRGLILSDISSEPAIEDDLRVETRSVMEWLLEE